MIVALTGNAYISADPHRSLTVAKRSKKTDAMIDAAAKGRRQCVGPVGHVRWRASLQDATDGGTVELFDGAMALADVQEREPKRVGAKASARSAKDRRTQ